MLTTLLGACDKHDDTSSLNNTDLNFMQMASYGNYNEIDAGTVAASRGNTAGVKSFGSMMQMDHGMAQNDLKTIGSQKSLNLPTGPDSAHVAMKQMLMTLSGRKFDSTYMSGQVKDHQTTISLFQNEISNGNDPDVKNFATIKLPTIQMHYQMADSIAKRL